VVFVCWGNICRSPMAERVARRAAREAGLSDVEFTSAATSAEELGEPMDPRAANTLRRAGYDPDGHLARQVSATQIQAADLVIGMEGIHLAKMRALRARGARLHLLSEFDPAASPGSGLPDPWYGSDAGFSDTLHAIEAAIPGVLERVRELQETS
jgi:protein-tyrosine phosphatase